MLSLPSLLLFSLLLAGCPDKKEPTSSQVPEYQRASDGVKARIPGARSDTEGLPTDKAVKGLQKTMVESEDKQDKHLQQADEAAEKQ